jgi:hypothetical protein
MQPEPKKGTKEHREWKYQKDLAELLIKIRKGYENNTLKWMKEHGLVKG